MARATKILNKYEIKLLALSDRDINYDNFYKEELIAFCKCLKEEYKKQKEAIDKLSKKIYEIDDLQKLTGGYPSHYVDDLVDILKEVSE